MNNRDDEDSAFHPDEGRMLYLGPEKNILVTSGQPMHGESGGNGGGLANPNNGSGGLNRNIGSREFNALPLGPINSPTPIAHVPAVMGQFAGPIYRTQGVRAKLINQEQQAILARTPEQVRAEIGHALNYAGAPQNLSALDTAIREKGAVDHLIAVKNNEIASHTAIANAFYGGSPLNRPFHEFTKRATALQHARTHEDTIRVFNDWLRSYHSAHIANNLAEAVRHLTAHSAALTATIAALTAQQLAQQQAEEAARRVAQQQAEAAAQLLAQQQAAAALRKAEAEHQVKINAEARLQTLIASIVAVPATQGTAGALEAGASIILRNSVTGLAAYLGVGLLLYSPKLANGERAPSVIKTPLAQLALPAGLDFGYIASVSGTVDVSHRLVVDAATPDTPLKWVVADGVRLGTKVRVRALTYNADTNTYEFIRDGESTPALVWTPIASSGGSSTSSPAAPPSLPVDPGVSVEPVGQEIEVYPEVGPDDYILVFPVDSGHESTYVSFNTRHDAHGYHPTPSLLPGFPEAKMTKSKTAIQGGGSRRARWKDRDGKIYEWDSRHGAVEKYDKRGNHLGEFNYETGIQNKPADPTRKVEP